MDKPNAIHVTWAVTYCERKAVRYRTVYSHLPLIMVDASNLMPNPIEPTMMYKRRYRN